MLMIGVHAMYTWHRDNIIGGMHPSQTRYFANFGNYRRPVGPALARHRQVAAASYRTLEQPRGRAGFSSARLSRVQNLARMAPLARLGQLEATVGARPCQPHLS